MVIITRKITPFATNPDFAKKQQQLKQCALKGRLLKHFGPAVSEDP